MKTKDDDVLRLLKHLTLRIEMLLSGTVPAPDITPVQCDVLGCVLKHQRKGESVNSTMLHKEMHLSRATVSSLVKKLRVAGYLEFVPDPRDERQKQIRLTEKADRHREKFDRIFAQMHDKVFFGFSEDEKQESIRLLNKMLQNVDAAIAGKEAAETENMSLKEEPPC